MKNFILAATGKTPEIILVSNGTFAISGDVRPQDPRVFFQPVFDWINEFKKHPSASISLIFNLSYVNTSSTRVILDLIRSVCDVPQEKTKTHIIWKYEASDYDMLDLGKSLHDTVKFPITFEETPD